MPIQLDKILADIAREKYLHPNYPDATKSDTDEAWDRVSKSNMLSVHEARSIFKVLQKKYEQEKQKGKSAWKLFSIMEEIHRKIELKPAIKQEEDTELPMEEDEEYEMLEVQEEDDQPNNLQQPATNSTGSASSDNESPVKSNSSNGASDKDDTPISKPITYGKSASSTNNISATVANSEEKKLLNNMVSATTSVRNTTSSTVEALHKKGITLKKANTPITKTNTTKTVVTGTNTHTKGITARIGGHLLEVGKTIQLPENLKRKLCEDQSSSPTLKKIHITGQNAKTSNSHSNATDHRMVASQTNSTAASIPITTTTSQLMQIKQEREDVTTAAHGINLITIPANPTRAEIAQTVGNATGPTSSTAATVASTASTNGFSPRIEDIDFRNDIIFDAGNGLNGTSATVPNNKVHHGTNASDIINLGNFDNSLPPTFFKNLCNSSRHEALGLYVANVMNRLGTRSAAKLELGILRAIIDVQSDELEQ